MTGLTQAVYDALRQDPELVALLASYPANSSDPAVFTADPAPDDATLPYIVSAGEVSVQPFDTHDRNGVDLLRDIRCYAEKTGSVATIEQISDRVRRIFHRQSFQVPGWSFRYAAISGPIVNDELDAYGRILTVRFVLEE